MHRFLGGVALIVACGISLGAPAQDSQPVPAPPAAPASAKRAEFFSGIVSAVDENSVTVTRKSITRDTVTRKFLRDSETKLEGKIHLKARVTVRFIPVEDGLRAVHIIVR